MVASSHFVGGGGGKPSLDMCGRACRSPQPEGLSAWLVLDTIAFPTKSLRRLSWLRRPGSLSHLECGQGGKSAPNARTIVCALLVACPSTCGGIAMRRILGSGSRAQPPGSPTSFAMQRGRTPKRIGRQTSRAGGALWPERSCRHHGEEHARGLLATLFAHLCACAAAVRCSPQGASTPRCRVARPVVLR